MRTITHADVVRVARSVMRVPEPCVRAEISRYLAQAHAADLYRKRFGRIHPFWGNGSLGGAVPHLPAGCMEHSLSSPAYLRAIASVIEAVLDWRDRAE
ncbi:MAG: hypothetical protein KDE03_07950 [Rhodobacteraceae bacterium]|nr:hypothetical protein [Paracoccaceae bacterium]